MLKKHLQIPLIKINQFTGSKAKQQLLKKILYPIQ